MIGQEIRKYGFRPNQIDRRDFQYAAEIPASVSSFDLADEVKLEDRLDFIFDQEDSNSCTGNAAARWITDEWKLAGLPYWIVSRLALYFFGRKAEGAEHVDDGANIADVIHGSHLWGFGPETLWPFILSKVNEEPSEAFKQAAIQQKFSRYAAVDNNKIDDMRHCLHSRHGIICGIACFDYFESDLMNQGKHLLNLPTASESLKGWHCIYIDGYKHSWRAFRVANSWGPGWGDKGHFYLSYDYVTSAYFCNSYMGRFK